MKAVIRLMLVLVLVGVCVILLGGLLLGERLPRLAGEKFGPASATLSFPQKTLYSFRLLSNEEVLLSPLDPAGKEQLFTIEMGESVASIAYRLETEHLIPDADAFRTYLVYAGLDKQVQAGEYHLSPAMPAVAIARQLMDAVPENVEFVILPGWRMEEVAAALPTSGIQVAESEFLEFARRPPEDVFPPGIPPAPTLEGFLLPDTYSVKRVTSARDMAAQFLARFDEEVTPEIRNGFAEQGLNLYEAVTLASMVQREAVVADEQAVIASVFYNRLAAGMRLESDPTVQYALGYQLLQKTWWKNPLSSADLRYDSSYNTYVYPGLPPGPISNPSLDVLRAVAFPERTNYYYFRARCDGSGRHSFSATYEEHLQNACP